MQDSIEDYIRISRNTKHLAPQPTQETVISTQIKNECDAKAMQILHFAIEGRMRPDALFRCLPYIDKSHYQDIVEERAITKICGYPLCSKKIPEMPKKQFFISVKNNKVYDITDRKNYCSNYCYRASLHLKNQIDTAPLWMRKHSEKAHFTLLHKSEKGLPGEVLNEGITKPSIEPSFTSVSAFTQMAVDEAEEFELVPEEESKIHSKKPPKKAQKTAMKTINEEEDQSEILESSKTFTKTVEFAESSRESDVESYVRQCFKNWLTLETFVFVHGDEKIKAKLDSKELVECFESLRVSELKLDQHRRYAEMCKKLRLKELSDEKFDNAVVGEKLLKPLPNYRQLKLENKDLDVKVKSFLSGQLHTDENNFAYNKKVEEAVEEDEGVPAVLPLLDTTCQIALRRKIFLNLLNKTVLVLLQALKISPSSVLCDLQDLVKTFELKADNIVFKPQVRNYVVVALLKILALRDEKLRQILCEDRCRSVVELWVSSLPRQGELIDHVVEMLLDVDSFIKNFVHSLK